jgi:hypothetical protein
MSIAKPSSIALVAAYTRYFFDSSPCEDNRIEHQCAVRLSVAMVRCGFTIRDEDVPDPRRIHRGRTSCRIPEDHLVGAQELERTLVKLWGPGDVFRGRAATGAASSLTGRLGIIYFNNCFTKRGQSQAGGDHIDLWNGSNYLNMLLGIGAGGNAGARDDLFSRSGNSGYYIRFFVLPS